MKNYNVKPLKTYYRGNYFRSRMEARWAYFFDLMGIRYVYELFGFLTDKGQYLPDFYLPLFDCYAEVKPYTLPQFSWNLEQEIKRLYPEDLKLWWAFVGTEKKLLLLLGNPHAQPMPLFYYYKPGEQEHTIKDSEPFQLFKPKTEGREIETVLFYMEKQRLWTAAAEDDDLEYKETAKEANRKDFGYEP